MISVRESLSFGWQTFTKRPWFFIGALGLAMIMYGALSWLTDPNRYASGIMPFLASLASIVLGLVIEMMLINVALKAHDSVETLALSDATVRLPFWPYFAAKFLTGIIVTVGFILLVVPGVIAALMLMFATYLVIDKGLGPIEAIKESARITKGHRWKLLLFVLSVAALNILGALILFVGLFVSIPVSILALVHVYRTLEHAASEVVAA